jgi:hypothetical protein
MICFITRTYDNALTLRRLGFEANWIGAALGGKRYDVLVVMPDALCDIETEKWDSVVGYLKTKIPPEGKYIQL